VGCEQKLAGLWGPFHLFYLPCPGESIIACFSRPGIEIATKRESAGVYKSRWSVTLLTHASMHLAQAREIDWTALRTKVRAGRVIDLERGFLCMSTMNAQDHCDHAWSNCSPLLSVQFNY
jgi:hypothetical protein